MQLGVGDEFITKIKALTQGGGQVAQKLLCSAPLQIKLLLTIVSVLPTITRKSIVFSLLL